jgi:hypothetical protein
VASARHNLPAEGDQPSDHPRQTAPFRGLIQRLNIVYGEHIPELGIQGVIDRILARVGDAKTYLTFDIAYRRSTSIVSILRSRQEREPRSRAASPHARR